MKVLAIIFLTYFLFKYFVKLLAPIILKRFVNKMQDRFNQQYQNQQETFQEEGKVTIEKAHNSTKRKSDNLGDYVDFEEVEE